MSELFDFIILGSIQKNYWFDTVKQIHTNVLNENYKLWRKKGIVDGHLNTPACPHIIVASNWLTIAHESKVHSRANKITIECQIHTAHREQGSLWYCQNSIHKPDSFNIKIIENSELWFINKKILVLHFYWGSPHLLFLSRGFTSWVGAS